MTAQDIDEFKAAWTAGAKRALAAGFDIVEVHAAHGYLMTEFLSPLSNKRTDLYGGSLENRMRLVLEVAQITRDIWPADKPVFVRISASEWDARGEKDEQGNWQSWGIEQSILLVKELKKVGIDLIDVSSGGNYSDQKIDVKPGYQVPFADQIKKAVPDMPVSSVGLITGGQQGEIPQLPCEAELIHLAPQRTRS